MLRLALIAAAFFGLSESAFAQAVDARNPVFNAQTATAGVVAGSPTGGNLGPGTVNAQNGVFVNGVAVDGGLSVPNSCVVSGNGSALGTVTLGGGLTCPAGVLTAPPGATPGGTTGQVQTNNGSGGLGALTTATTGASVVLQTTGAGTIANSVIPTPTTSALGGIIGLASQATGQFVSYIDTAGVQHLGTPAGGGNVSNAGTPTSGQLAQWNGSTTIGGVSAITGLTGGVVDTSGPSGTGFSTTGPLTIGGGPITANAGQGGVLNNTVAYNSISTEIRSRFLFDTVTNNSGSGIDEGLFFERMFLGSATYASEVNGIHVYFTDAAGMTFTAANNENFEASTLWNGAHASIASYIALPVMSTTGTLTSTGYGFMVSMTNNNTTTGSMANFVGFDYLPMGGGGSTPTNHFAFQNRDPTATAGFLGPVVMGTLGHGSAAQMLYIQGPDTSGSTFPLLIKSNAGASFTFSVNDAGAVQVWGGNLVTGQAGVNAGIIAFQNATSGNISLVVPTGAISGVLTLPSLTGTLATLNNAQSWVGKQTFAASTTSTAFLNLAQGAAPTSPVNGDIWTTASGVFAWINGASVGPFGAGGGGGGTVTSVSNSDGTITVATGTTTPVVSLNLANSNTWTNNQIIQGSTSDSSAIALKVINSSSAALFEVRNDGAIFGLSGGIIMGTAGSVQGSISLATTSAGGIVKILANNALAISSLIAIPSTVGANDTFALLGTSETFSAAVVTASGTWNFSGTFKINSVIVQPNLSGTATSLGGSALIAGACSSTTVAVTGLTTSMALDATPATFPGAGFFWYAYTSSAGTATVAVCAAVAGTPTTSNYVVRVLQ